MVLKNKADFIGDYEWAKLTPFEGCNAILSVTVENLKLVKPFSDCLSKEWAALLNFELNVQSRLDGIMFDERGKAKEHVVYTDAVKIYEDEVNALMKVLKTQDFRDAVYSVLMAACGVIVGLLAIAPLGVPLCFSSVRSYVSSFFKAPQGSALVFASASGKSFDQLKNVWLNEIECFVSLSLDEETEYSFQYMDK